MRTTGDFCAHDCGRLCASPLPFVRKKNVGCAQRCFRSCRRLFCGAEFVGGGGLAISEKCRIFVSQVSGDDVGEDAMND